jgi:hypothetical protein
MPASLKLTRVDNNFQVIPDVAASLGPGYPERKQCWPRQRTGIAEETWSYSNARHAYQLQHC